MDSTISADYMKFGDVKYDQSIIPLDENGNPQKLVPMAGFLDLFKKKETEFSSKVFINGEQTDLSVVKLPAEEYYDKVATDSVDAKTLYVLSSDQINAYDQPIVNVADPTDDTDAANKRYVDEKIDSIRQKAKALVKLDSANATSTSVLNTVNSLIDILTSI